MFKLILLLAISCLAMQPDKTLHFQAGLVSGAVVTMIAKDYTQSKSKQLLSSFLFASLLATTKELLDIKYGSGFDGEDAWCTVGGALVVSIPLSAL